MIRLRRKLSKAENQRGSALVATLAAMIAVTSLGTAVTFGVSSNLRQSDRDRNAKRAIAAAEAGGQEAAYRMNMLQPTSSSPCVTVSGGLLATAPPPGPGQWCAAQTIDVGSNATASYQISPYSISGGVVTRSIVSTGTVNGVSRRTLVTSSANTGAPLFEPFGISSNDRIRINGNYNNATAAVRSNNDIDLNGNYVSICGTPPTPATPGPGNSVHMNGNGVSVCGPTTPAASDFTLTAVDQGDARTNNDNGRLFTEDLKTGSPSAVTFNADSKVLTMNGSNATLTLSGHTYSFCKLTMNGNNLKLIIASDAVVRIYFDSTDNCGYQASTAQLTMNGNSVQIINPSDPTRLQIYMMGGNPTTSNGATMNGNGATAAMTFYGPYTKLTINGNNATFKGAIVAKQVDVNGNYITVGYDSQVESITQPTIGVYRQQKFIECTPANTGSLPDSGC